MQIHINSDEGYKIKLWLPTSLLRSKILIKIIKKKGGIDINPLMDMLPIIYKTLKKYIKKYGHFVLVDIESNDGNKVFIKV